jgi:hypothetical protein
MEESDPTEQWSKIKEIMLTKGENILGLKQRKEAKIGSWKKHGKK